MGTRPYFIHYYVIIKHCAIQYLLSHYPVLSPQSPPFCVEMPGIRTYVLALNAEQWPSSFWEVDISAQIWAFFSSTHIPNLNLNWQNLGGVSSSQPWSAPCLFAAIPCLHLTHQGCDGSLVYWHQHQNLYYGANLSLPRL